MEKQNKPLVVVLSRIYSTGLSVIRSLGIAGYTVDLVASAAKEGNSKVAASSKYVNNSVEIVSKKVKESNDRDLIEALLQYAGKYDEKIVLFPTDDYTASIMDINRDKLQDYFLMPSLANGGTLTEYMDKTAQSRVARSAGLFTPLEWTVSLESEDIIIPEDIVYPCYCKPIASILGYKTEMAVCNNKEELKEVLYRLRERFSKRSILIQEFLKIDQEIDMSGVCADQEIIIPAVTRKTKIAQHEKGVAITGQIIPFEELGAVQEKVINFLRKFKYTGMFHMDLNVVGDKIYFGELNLRSGGPNFIYFASGVNLPELFVKEILEENHDLDEERVKEYGKTFVYEKIAWEEYLNGLISRAELDKLISDSDVKLLYSDNDPVPEEIFKARMEKADKRKVLKDECIANAMELTDWDYTYAEQQIKDTRKRLGISYIDYRKYEFCLVPTEEQEEKYKEITERKERRKRRKEECIVDTMEKTGWNREYAEQQIKDARGRLGISYNDYKKYEFCLVPIEKQEEKYDVIVNVKKKKSSN